MFRWIIPVLVAVVVESGCSNKSLPVPPPAAPSTPSPPATLRLPPSVALVGVYELALIASPSCATVTGADPLTHEAVPFPDSIRTRTYATQIAQDAAGNVQMILQRGECVPCSAGGGGEWDATVSGRELTFSVPGSAICAGGDYWWESLSADREWFEVCGAWSASVDDPQHIVGTHVGTFAYHHLVDPTPEPHPGAAWVNLYCQASDHRFTLTKK